METEIKFEKWKINLLLFSLILFALIIFLQTNDYNYGVVESASTINENVQNELNNEPEIDLTISYPSIKTGIDENPEFENFTAKSYLIYDIETEKILTYKDIDLALPIASLTKLTTALAVSRNLSPDDVVTINSAHLSGIVSPKLNLVNGEKITVAALTEGMLVSSANDAAEILGVTLGKGKKEDGIILMNNLATSLGTKNTNYANATGFDEPTSHSTAKDLLPIVLEIYRNPWLMSSLSKTKGSVSSVDKKIVHTFKTTNSLLYNFTDGIWAGKTGFTENARGNLVVFAKNRVGGDVLVILLGSENRESDITQLISWTFNNFNW